VRNDSDPASTVSHACVPLALANDLKKILISRGWLLEGNKPTRAGELICFPLAPAGRTPDTQTILEELLPEVTFQDFLPQKPAWTRPRTLAEALRGYLPRELEVLLPKSWDIMGTVAVIEGPKDPAPELDPFWGNIGQAVVLVNPAVQSVFLKESAVQGEFRTRALRCIAGPDITETIYKENDCMFKLDVRKVFFTPRLVTERARVASLPPTEDELVFDMFAGVGPFAIERAKAQGVPVIAADKNPAAIYYLEQNVVANRVAHLVTPVCADAATVGEWPLDTVSRRASRVIMNLPERSLEFVPQAVLALRPEGGILHIYQFCQGEDVTDNAVQQVREALQAINATLEGVINAKIVKPYAPHEFLTVVDALVTP